MIIVKKKDLEMTEVTCDKIFMVRDIQVMLDKDLAKLYQVSTGRLNEQIKRHIERFPDEFRFQLTKDEYKNLRSQFAISSFKMEKHGGRRYLPYVFTEQGVTMLASVLHSNIAIRVSIEIIKTFVKMRQFLTVNAGIFQRLEGVEKKQIKTDKNVQKILNVLEDKKLEPRQGIFYNGQVFDAYILINKIIQSAKKSIVLIDNYINEDTLQLFSQRSKNVSCAFYTKKITKKLELDIKKFNEQYQMVDVYKFDQSHDRFLIIDKKDLYHIGASLKDLGKRWFAFSKIDMHSVGMLKKLEAYGDK